MDTHEQACELHAAELVRVKEVADLVARLADPQNTFALSAALTNTSLHYADRQALDALRLLCWQMENAVDSYIKDMREEAAA